MLKGLLLQCQSSPFVGQFPIKSHSKQQQKKAILVRITFFTNRYWNTITC